MGAFGSDGHEIGIVEYAEVLRDGRPTDREVGRDLVDRLLLIGDETKDFTAGWFGERLGDGIPGGTG